MGVAAGPAASYMHIRALLAVAAHLLLLEAAARIAAHHHVGLVVRVRHVVRLLLGDGLAAVRCDWSARRAVDHAAGVARTRQRVICATLVMHGLILRRLEAGVNTLRHHLIERAADLLLRLVVVYHALSVRFARGSQIVLIVPAVS